MGNLKDIYFKVFANGTLILVTPSHANARRKVTEMVELDLTLAQKTTNIYINYTIQKINL